MSIEQCTLTFNLFEFSQFLDKKCSFWKFFKMMVGLLETIFFSQPYLLKQTLR